ncbi:PREDICTED: leukosialin [Chinchilla lanigera]|uniref:leukosialin n=1 Tax=Chinchilla lanigera TaxID=34839 RepID=UPI00069629EA|nr:PREDICTED: leukosialin [Chinchilla lanigera]
MALLLLLLGSLWAPLASPQNATTALVSDAVTSLAPNTRPSLKYNTSDQAWTPTPSAPPLGTSGGASTGPAISEPVSSKEESTKKPSAFPEIAIGTSDPAVPTEVSSQGYPTATGGALAFNSQETSGGTSESSVTSARSYVETSSGVSGTSVTMTTSSPEPSSGNNETSVTMTTSSPDPSSGNNETSVTMTNSAPEPASGDNGTSVTMTTSSPEPSRGASGPPVAATTSSLVTSSAASSSSAPSTKASVGSTPKLSADTSARSPGSPGPGRRGTLLVPLLVALLVVAVLVALLALWRRRQKRRTGVLTLSGGKRSGAVDAWAGPARVGCEEAVPEAPGGAKGAGVPAAEGCAATRPALTTFFGRRRSQQGSLAMEELRARPGAGLQGEEQPLVGSEDEAAEGPAPDGPAPGGADGAAPLRL